MNATTHRAWYLRMIDRVLEALASHPAEHNGYLILMGPMGPVGLLAAEEAHAVATARYGLGEARS